jgi:hypothetical protein
MSALQRCVNPACAAEYPVDRVLTKCEACGALLDIVYAAGSIAVRDFSKFERRSGTTGPRGPAGGSASKSALNFSGVWRFRDLLPFYEDESQIVTIGEGRTNLQRADALGKAIGYDCSDSDECGRFYSAVRGLQPVGLVQGQRHVRRLHARADGRRDPRRVRLDRQHVGGARAVREPDGHARVRVHRRGQDRLRQAEPGARLRRDDAAGRGRLRRVHGAREGDRAGPPRARACTWSTA